MVVALWPKKASPVMPLYLKIGVIFFVAYIVRFAMLFQLKQTPFFTAFAGEGLFYDYWGEQISAGDLLAGDRVYAAPPLIMYYLGALYEIFGRNLTVVRIVGALLDSLLCVLIYFAGRKIAGDKAGFAGGILAALYSGFLFYEVIMPGTALSVTLTLLAFLAILWADSAEGRSSCFRWTAAGLLIGLAALGRPNLLGFVPVVIIWRLAARKCRKISTLSIQSLTFVLGLLLVLSPVLVRNYVVEKDLVFLPHMGIALYTGNNPDLPEGYGKDPRLRGSINEFDIGGFRKMASAMNGRKLKSSEVSSFFFERGVRFIIQEPGKFFQRLLIKTRSFWSKYEVSGDWDQEFLADRVNFLKAPFLIQNSLLLALAFGGLLFYGLKTTGGKMLGVIIATYLAMVVPFVVLTRYRLTIMPFLIILGGLFIAGFTDDLLRRRGGKILWAALVLIVILGLYSLEAPPFEEARMHAYSWVNMGVLYEQKGDYDQAMKSYAIAVQNKPSFTEAYFYAGDLAFTQGDHDGALAWYEKGVMSGQASAGEHYALYLLYKLKGEKVKADGELALARSLDPWLDTESVPLSRIMASGLKRGDRNEPGQADNGAAWGNLPEI